MKSPALNRIRDFYFKVLRLYVTSTYWAINKHFTSIPHNYFTTSLVSTKCVLLFKSDCSLRTINQATGMQMHLSTTRRRRVRLFVLKFHNKCNQPVVRLTIGSRYK